MIRKLRGITNKTVNKETKWRHNRPRAHHRLQPALGQLDREAEETRNGRHAEKVKPEAGKLVDMSWDPITRIVGNLGIYTKIDFEQPARSSSARSPPRCSAATACS